MLTKAANSGYNYPMAFFLLGIANFELGLYDSANSAFKDAGSIMDNAGITTINYECGAPDYTLKINLTSEEAKQNEVSSAYASTLVGKQGRMYPVLHRLPAGLLFKHPTATPIYEGWPIKITTETNRPTSAGVQSGGLTAINRHEAEPYATSQTSSSSPSLDEHKPASTRRLLVKRSYSQSDGSEEVRSPCTERTEKPKRSFPLRLLRRRKSEGTTTTISNDTSDSDMEQRTLSPRTLLDRKKSRSQHMLCREPKTKDTSPRELLSFLEETQPKLTNKAPRLQPRDAQVQHHDMYELAQFAKHRTIRDSMVQTAHTEYSLNTEEGVERSRAPFRETSIQGLRGGDYYLQSTHPNNNGPNEKAHVRFRDVSDRDPSVEQHGSPTLLRQSTTSSNVMRRSSVYSFSEGVCSSGESIGHDMIDTPMTSPVFRPDSSTLGQAAYFTLETEHEKDRKDHMLEEVAGLTSSTDSLVSTASDIDEPISTPKRNKLVRREILRMLDGLPKTSIRPFD